VLDLVAHLNHLLGTDLQPLFAAARAGDVRHSQAHISAARRDLGYDPSVSFPEGLRLTLEAHRSGQGGDQARTIVSRWPLTPRVALRVSTPSRACSTKDA
jgi:hypothetical protein